MSFSAEQKEQITNSVYKTACCRRSLLLGILFAKGNLDGECIVLKLDGVLTAEFVSKLVREFYNAESTLYRDTSGGRRIMLKFKSVSAAKYISNIAKLEELFIGKCQNCRPSFLKGVFLAAGRVSDPAKSYTLEFSLGERSHIFSNLLLKLGMNPSILKDEMKTLYFRSSTGIEEYFANAGMNGAMFSVIEARFNGEAKLNIHRVTNCYTNNISKTVDAASQQIKIINALNEANLLSSLPDELEATARLRLEYPDFSLAQLSAVSVPKISKPGLSHRLKKLIEVGDALLHNKKEN